MPIFLISCRVRDGVPCSLRGVVEFSVQLANRKLALQKSVQLANRKLALQKSVQLANRKLALQKKKPPRSEHGDEKGIHTDLTVVPLQFSFSLPFKVSGLQGFPPTLRKSTLWDALTGIIPTNPTGIL
jgi:hypothetical protein